MQDPPETAPSALETDGGNAGETKPAGDSKPPGKGHGPAGWKIRIGVLIAMLMMALVGLGLTQASETGAWEFWLFVVAVYAGLDLWSNVRFARRTGKSITKSVGRALAHWLTLLGFLAVVFLLESREIVNRDSASYFALMLLALSCCLAGVHIDPLLLVVGIVLTIMLIATAILQQYTFVLWGTMVLVSALAVAFFYFSSKRKRAEDENA